MSASTEDTAGPVLAPIAVHGALGTCVVRSRVARSRAAAS